MKTETELWGFFILSCGETDIALLVSDDLIFLFVKVLILYFYTLNQIAQFFQLIWDIVRAVLHFRCFYDEFVKFFLKGICNGRADEFMKIVMRYVRNFNEKDILVGVSLHILIKKQFWVTERYNLIGSAVHYENPAFDFIDVVNICEIVFNKLHICVQLFEK